LQQHRPAERMFARALAMAQQMSDTQSQIAVLLNLSKTKFETFRLESAHADLLRGLALFEQYPDPGLKGSYLVNLAAIERVQLKLDVAWQRVLEAVELAKSQGATPKIAQRSLILAEMALERGRCADAKTWLLLAREHLIPELEPMLLLHETFLVLSEQQPQAVLTRLENQEFIGDDLEFAAALRGFAALELGTPDASVLDITTTGLYSPLLHAAQIRTRAALGCLEAAHLETRPLEQVVPFMRLELLKALIAHHPEPERFKQGFKKLRVTLHGQTGI
jgi:hypothetical protein